MQKEHDPVIPLWDIYKRFWGSAAKPQAESLHAKIE